MTAGVAIALVATPIVAFVLQMTHVFDKFLTM
jgi:hypothetical protein